MSVHTINGRGDLAFDGEIRPYIGQQVELVKRTKAGRYQVRASDGTLHTISKRNLTPPPTECALCASGMNSFTDPDIGKKMHARNGEVVLCENQ